MIRLGQQTMINQRGRVVWVTVEEVEMRKAKFGWKIVHNPTRDYYPEFDLAAGGRSAPENIIDDLVATDILIGEEV